MLSMTAGDSKNSWRMHVLWAYPTERAQSISLVVVLNSLLEHELPFAVPKQQACCITSTRLRAITRWQRGVVILVTNAAECWKSQHSWDHQVSVTGIREATLTLEDWLNAALWPKEAFAHPFAVCTYTHADTHMNTNISSFLCPRDLNAGLQLR